MAVGLLYVERDVDVGLSGQRVMTVGRLAGQRELNIGWVYVQMEVAVWMLVLWQV